MSDAGPSSATPGNRPPLWLSLIVCGLLVVIMGMLRLGGSASIALPVGYGVPIILAAWTRSRRLLWIMAAIFVAMTIAEFWFIPHHPDPVTPSHHLMALLVLVDLIVVTAVVDLLMQQQFATERQQERVASQNKELAAGRDEIARQVRELDEYQHRLEKLLDLSRSLTIETPRERALERICQTLHSLVPGAQAVAVLQCDGQGPRILCQDGFGPDGPDLSGMQDHQTLGHRVSESGSTAFIDGNSEQSEVQLPRFHDGARLRSGLAAPLKIADRLVGTLEVYSAQARAWSPREIALIESLAAQASVSMAAADVVLQLQQEQQRLDERRRHAEEASTRKSRFLAAVSHDIRTPANAISLLAELIQRSVQNPNATEEIPELAKELHASALSMINLISDVLDLTRLDAGRVDLQETEFDFGHWLAEDCRKLAPLAEEKHLEFVCKGPQAIVRVRADRIKLSRVLTNLVGNAIKFTERGTVQVLGELVGDEGRIQISVSDTGVGISPENQERIFDEFSQLKNPDREKQKGTGLGLSISRRLMESMSGRLSVVSEPGKGSTFTATLPPRYVVKAGAT